MKYILLFTMDPSFETMPEADVQAMYGRVGEWWEKHTRSGALVGGEQLQPPRTATTVRPREGTVTDGPFMEAKEGIGGYALIDVADLDAAIAMAKSWPASPAVEIRPVVEDTDHM